MWGTLLFFLMLIGSIFSYYFDLIYQGGIIICFILFMFTPTFRNADIGQFFLVLYFVFIVVGFCIGNGFYYWNNKVLLQKENLPELNCKSGENSFSLKEYTISDNKITNLKTDQIFEKNNCTLK